LAKKDTYSPSVLMTFLRLIFAIIKLIAFPVRKPVVGLFLLLVLIGVPYALGVKPPEMLGWYKEKASPVLSVFSNYGNSMKKHTGPLVDQMSKVTNAVISAPQKLKEIQTAKTRESNINNMMSDMAGGVELKELENTGGLNISKSDISQYEGMNGLEHGAIEQKTQAEIQKEHMQEVFKKSVAKSNIYALPNGEEKQVASVQMPAPIKIEIADTSNLQLKEIEKPVSAPVKPEKFEPKITMNDIQGKSEFSFAIKENYNPPMILEGFAKVLSPEFIKISESPIYLYGIVASSNVDEREKARNFSSQLIGNSIVSCKIMGLTEDNIPAGICSAGIININKTLVQANLVSQVADL